MFFEVKKAAIDPVNQPNANYYPTDSPASPVVFPTEPALINTYLSTPASDAHVLNDALIHLLFSANRWETRESLLKQLADGQTGRDHVLLNPAVICDRYAYSLLQRGLIWIGARRETSAFRDQISSCISISSRKSLRSVVIMVKSGMRM
jgi:hypothetical protein